MTNVDLAAAQEKWRRMRMNEPTHREAVKHTNKELVLEATMSDDDDDDDKALETLTRPRLSSSFRPVPACRNGVSVTSGT